MKTSLSIAILFVFPFFSFCQTAFTASMSLVLENREYDFSRPVANLNPGINHHIKWRTSQFPVLDFSLVKFHASGNFNRYSLRGLAYRVEDNLTIIEEKTTGLEEPVNGVRNTHIGSGFRYAFGWKTTRTEGRWAFFITPFAGLRYDYLGSEPKSSASFPVRINSGKLEAGLGGQAVFSFGKTGFLTFGLPLSFYETGFDTIDYLNPVLTSHQQRQTSFHHNFEFWKRSGLEIGAGFYLK